VENYVYDIVSYINQFRYSPHIINIFIKDNIVQRVDPNAEMQNRTYKIVYLKINYFKQVAYTVGLNTEFKTPIC
jgi:hypothetical protein